MKDIHDIRRRVQTEVDHYFARHAGEAFFHCYLWYYPTSAIHDGGIQCFGADVNPNDPKVNNSWELVTPEALRGGESGEMVAQRLINLNILARLPVLAITI